MNCDTELRTPLWTTPHNVKNVNQVGRDGRIYSILYIWKMVQNSCKNLSSLFLSTASSEEMNPLQTPKNLVVNGRKTQTWETLGTLCTLGQGPGSDLKIQTWHVFLTSFNLHSPTFRATWPFYNSLKWLSHVFKGSLHLELHRPRPFLIFQASTPFGYVVRASTQ